MKLEEHCFLEADGPAMIPLFACNMERPTEGFPPLIQFGRWAESIWSSYEARREPFEVHPNR